MSSTATTPLFPGGGTHPQTASAGSGWSYTPVLVVLGVIAALLVISCLVGQVCTKRHLRPRPRRDRVAFYDDDMEGGFGHGHPPHGHAMAKMEAPTPSAASVVETRPADNGAAAVHQQTAAR
ncbi:hypothetical protein QOZ80_5AG0362680 [Eleusine coracana subsp. coracana]|nr:hypothetical protein QOZ80_5AG0362680 [Eleusine coracana subsp. coracana]